MKNLGQTRGNVVLAFVFITVSMWGVFGLGPGQASAVTVPTGYPRWFIGQAEMVRDAGTALSVGVMQQISDLFEQSGRFGCSEWNPTASPPFSQCDLYSTNETTDASDNFDRVEVVSGTGEMNSNLGLTQLCDPSFSPFPVDFARSAEGTNDACSGLVALGFAKDALPTIDFPDASGPGTATSEFPNVTTPGKVVGPVAAGWLPGDPVTCNTGAANSSSNPLNRTSNPRVGILANSCSGVPLEDMDNNAGPSPSTAYNIWCNDLGSGNGQITDWGQLTNLTGSELPGQGSPIGVPITLVSSDDPGGSLATWGLGGPLEGTFPSFVGDCTTGLNATTIDSQPVAASNGTVAPVGQVASSLFPNSDPTQTADQAALVATSLFWMSNGVYNTCVTCREVQVSNGTLYAANKMLENEVTPTTTQSGTLMENTYPTAYTLSNVYDTNSVRASTADFLNWICDANQVFTKGVDQTTGKNYDTEITTAIDTLYGFIRLTDATASPNNSCQLISSVANPNS